MTTKTRNAKKTTTTKTRRDLYQETTDAIVAALENGVSPWRRPWKENIATAFTTDGRPRNAVSGRPYRGGNVPMLDLAAMIGGYDDPRWLTFKQARDLGGPVNKGEKGTLVTFWKFFKTEDKDTGKETSIPMLRSFVVFNVAQCADTLKLPELKLPNADVPLIDRCENTIRDMPKRPAITRTGDAAYYTPSRDTVTMPHIASFDSAEDWYHVAFHELAHATGHESRLNRSGVTSGARFGSEVYSKEELVAEIASAMVGRAVGIDPVIERNAAYCQSWAKRLKDDPKLFMQAAGMAQKAADAILGESVAASDDNPTRVAEDHPLKPVRVPVVPTSTVEVKIVAPRPVQVAAKDTAREVRGKWYRMTGAGVERCTGCGAAIGQGHYQGCFDPSRQYLTMPKLAPVKTATQRAKLAAKIQAALGREAALARG